MNPIDGGPAFPVGSGDMQGLLAQSLGTALESDPILGAQYAYRVADAMLAVRRETKR